MLDKSDTPAGMWKWSDRTTLMLFIMCECTATALMVHPSEEISHSERKHWLMEEILDCLEVVTFTRYPYPIHLWWLSNNKVGSNNLVHLILIKNKQHVSYSIITTLSAPDSSVGLEENTKCQFYYISQQMPVLASIVLSDACWNSWSQITAASPGIKLTTSWW